MDEFQSLGQLFYVLLALLVILTLAYYSIKLLGRGTYLRRKSNNLHLVEALTLGTSGHISIVKIGSKYHLLGITKERINYLTQIDAEDVTEPEMISEVPEFSKVFDKFRSMNNKNKE